MLTEIANGDFSSHSFWLHVREFAVPPSMIETATARRRAGDWAGACAAAGVDVDLDLRALARTHGQAMAGRVRADLRQLVPDLLRWHLPRIAPDGLLRPGLTVTLARYDDPGPVHLVVRTPPAWADAGQRVSLALWDGSRSAVGDGRHPHPRPSRRFRLDLHRHLWDARRTDELRVRSSGDGPPALEPPGLGRGFAVDRWVAEAGILLAAEGRPAGPVSVHLGTRRRLVLDPAEPGWCMVAARGAGAVAGLPVLPDAATRVLPDLELLRAGLISVDRLHPLIAAALVPGRSPTAPGRPSERRAGGPRLVLCRGARHRIGLVDGVLTALDHDPAQIRREELLAALTGTPLPCLQAIELAHRQPECLDGVRERLNHGDAAGALAVVEELLGPEARLRDGALRHELQAAALRRIDYGLFRAGLAGPGPGRVSPDDHRPRNGRSHPRHASAR
ncbi:MULTISPECIES: hypothetical protein [Kitasatospora]|uniref:hypothetical protein n=1 Tax=Kitasatospora TaxID=2063 RepID=UPI000C71432B|nr:hypothetical protein [Kitasatospora sp. GP30]MDH6145604.1 hypothetical protein [Kitasatospora sp. GP30]